MNVPLPTHQPKPAVCGLLRTKTAFGFYEGDEPVAWELGESSTAVYWCLATMQSAGPDESFAHPQQCQAGRECYRAREC